MGGEISHCTRLLSHWPVPTASPVVRAARHRLGALAPHCQPRHGIRSLEMHSPVWVARTGSGAQQHYCRNTLATFHPLLSKVWGQDFLGFTHLPSPKRSKIGDSSHKLPQASPAGLTSSNSHSPGQYDVLQAIAWTYSTICWPSLASTQ